MTETETERPTPQGSRFLGTLGAFLGALLGAVLTILLIYLLPEDVGKLTILFNMISVGWAGCRGYRLFRGYRSMKFAQWTVRAAVILAQPLALAFLLTFTVLRMAWGTLPLSPGDVFFAFVRSLTLLLRDFPTPTFFLVLGTLLFCRLSWTGLLKYVDPAWYADPRRLARVGGGGATFNVPPCWPLPPADALPQSFEVDKGRLTVEGSTLTYKAWAKPRRSFSAGEIAGVVLGVGSGYNILYDRENRELARFAWSRKNALLFGQYLIAHGIPFIDPNGEPVSTQAPAAPAALPDTFTLRQPRWAAVVGWIGLLFFGAAAIFTLRLVDFSALLLCGGVFLLFLLLSLYLLLARRNQRLEVEGQQLTYTSLWGKTTSFPLSEIDRGILTNGRLKLLSREGKPLIKLGLEMENASLLTQYLQAHQIPLGPTKPRKD